MDFVKRVDNNKIDDGNYKAYTETLHKSQPMDSEYQHTPISMEQLHQAMQVSNFHNLPIPISPRQMSTLMLKTNHLNRNINFNEIPAHLPRNLTSEIEFVHSLNEDITRNIEAHIARNMSSEELQQHLGMSEQDLQRSLELQHLRNDLTAQSLRDFSMNHELDLSQHVNRNMDVERRTPVAIQCVPDTMLEQNISQRLLGHMEQNIAQMENQRLVNQMSMDDGRLDNEHLPVPFHIKAEQEDDGYFYDPINQNFVNNVNSLAGQISMQDHNQPAIIHQDPQPLYNFNNHVSNLNPPLASQLDLYCRPQNFVQNYALNNTRENPQNLVIQKPFENQTQFDEFKKMRQDGVTENSGKTDAPKIEANENEKPQENKLPYYNEFRGSLEAFVKKNENDASENNKIESQDPLSIDIKGEYICYKCNEVFPSKRGLKQHSRSCSDGTTEQEKVGKFSCTQCAYRCQSPAILKIHERTHTGEKPFSCSFCDYKSGQKNNVAKHILVHMKEKPFCCQYCEYRCAQKNNLVVHERTHTGYKPFACPYCDYRTVQKPNLVKHMYLHTDQKPFSCDVCSYRCVQKTNLTKHKQRHLTEKEGEKSDFQTKPYKPRQKTVKCPQCSYRCVQKASLDKHMMFKHDSSVNSDINVNSAVICDETIQNLSVKKEGQLYDVSDKQESECHVDKFVMS